MIENDEDRRARIVLAAIAHLEDRPDDFRMAVWEAGNVEPRRGAHLHEAIQMFAEAHTAEREPLDDLRNWLNDYRRRNGGNQGDPA